MTIKYHQLTQLTIGDAVRLNSGGPDMMIVDFLGLSAQVSYPDPDHDLCVLYTFFPIACLRKI